MNVDITGRHVEVTDALREFTEDKLKKLEKLLDGPLEVHVVLAISKHRHVAEIQVKSRTAVLSAMEETNELYASIGEVADKLERQALKHKEKVTGRKRRVGTRLADAVAVMEREDSEATVEEAQGPRVIRTEGYRLKPLSVEDAVLELEAGDEEVLVFRERSGDRLSVLYRRRDGNIGLVEPEF